MTTIEQAWIDCLLADVAYVDRLLPGMTGTSLADRIEARMTQPVAEFIGAKFEVVSVENDRPSDFQGVVFRDKATGDLYLANRGTAPGKSFQDVVDDIDLALSAGIARTQTAAMVNWWLAISAPRGETVRQIASTGGVLTPSTRIFVAKPAILAEPDH